MQNVQPSEDKVKLIVQIVYILHSISILIGICTGGSVLTAFLFGWPSILAVILNYIFRKEARGMYLESHFSWQIRTFWYSFLWTVIVMVVGLIFSVALFGFAIWWLGFIVLGLWVAYRIIFGWYRLSSQMSI